MYWTLHLASKLVNAPWEHGFTKKELIDYAERNGLPSAVIEKGSKKRLHSDVMPIKKYYLEVI